jgi:Bacterial archaeo-eukaryotic release factor family 3
MDTAKAEVTEFRGLQDLKPLLSSPGPCVTVYLTLNRRTVTQNEKAHELEWREAIRSIEPKLQELGQQGREFRETLAQWATISQDQLARGKAVAVFRSPNIFRVTSLYGPVPSRAVVAPRFYIRPLLPELVKPQNFYILALSQKDVRLLRCTRYSSEEVALPFGTSTDYEAYMATAKPDRQDTLESTAGPSAGHTKGVVGTTYTVKESKPQYLSHFFQQIDAGVNELLRGSSDPVILAAVDYELALYRSVNTYRNLLDQDIQGAPNSLKSGEMHARALEAINRSYDKKVEDILAEYNHKVGGGASNRLKDIVTAAHDGRVLTLLISDSLETPGVFDEATYSVKGRPTGTTEQEDLVNATAVQTILHAGQVFEIPNKKMPDGAPAVAIFRY